MVTFSFTAPVAPTDARKGILLVRTGHIDRSVDRTKRDGVSVTRITGTLRRVSHIAGTVDADSVNGIIGDGRRGSRNPSDGWQGHLSHSSPTRCLSPSEVDD